MLFRRPYPPNRTGANRTGEVGLGQIGLGQLDWPRTWADRTGTDRTASRLHGVPVTTSHLNEKESLKLKLNKSLLPRTSALI